MLEKKNKFFDFNQSKEVKKEEKLNEVWTSKYIASHFQKIESLENDLMRVPTKDEFFFLQTDKAFNAFTFIPFVAKIYPIKELYACTYSISSRVIDALIEMHDKGMIEQITLLISESMIKRNPKTIDNLKAMCTSRPNMKVLYAWSHAKVCLMKTHDFHFVIEGSGNWAENAHYEQYLFANSKGLYDFRLQLFTTIKMIKY
ncbi:phospholipase D-like domain-containing protein [Flavobacterium facile]|uniref:hypothetical protein n=1 Tax=Flavobacterium facile TaxID=2893174 RepID=UPI002E76D34C|nr:hypothetical protein [Flavobacterium sp. T-12]